MARPFDSSRGKARLGRLRLGTRRVERWRLGLGVGSSVAPPFGCWSAAFRAPCLVSTAPPKIPCVWFSHNTASSDLSARCLPVLTPSPSAIRRSPALCRAAGSALPPSWSAGQMRPHVPRRHLGLHRVTGAVSSYPATEVLCPRRRSPPHLGSPTGPSLCCGCSVRGVLGTTARSARLAPTDRLRLGAYTVRLAVRGRSRRGPSPSQLCVARLVSVPLPVRRRGPRVRLPVSSPRMPAFAELCPARPPVLFPRPTSAGVPLRRGSIRLMLRPGDSFAPLGESHPRGRQKAYPSELSPGRSPKPDVRLTTRSDGQSARPISHRLVHDGYWLRHNLWDGTAVRPYGSVRSACWSP